MKKIILMMIFCLAIAANIFGQAKEISFEESHQQLIAAFKKEYKGKWRINLTYEYFKNEKLSSKTETITENDSFADRMQKIETRTADGRVEKLQLIRIKETYYCRENNAAWKKFDAWCDNDALFSGNTGEEESAKYTVEDTKLNNQNTKLYRQYIIQTDGKTKTYWDYKFWVSANGFILRREIETGSLNPKTVFSKMTEIREYNAKNIKIFAPIK